MPVQAAQNRPCRIASRPDVPILPAGPRSLYRPIGASGWAKRTRFGAYYRIPSWLNRGGPENPSSKPLPDTTGMVSKIPRFPAILGVGLRTLANCHCDAKIPMAIG
jgi:hypothetical protein